MAYKGTTELSSIANPPRSVSPAMWSRRSTTVLSATAVCGQNLWMHNSTDSSTDFISTTYFVDGFYLGMKEGDIIMGAVCTGTGTSVSVYLGVIGPVTTNGCGIASSGGHLSSTR